MSLQPLNQKAGGGGGGGGGGVIGSELCTNWNVFSALDVTKVRQKRQI